MKEALSAMSENDLYVAFTMHIPHMKQLIAGQDSSERASAFVQRGSRKKTSWYVYSGDDDNDILLQLTINVLSRM